MRKCSGKKRSMPRLGVQEQGPKEDWLSRPTVDQEMVGEIQAPGALMQADTTRPCSLGVDQADTLREETPSRGENVKPNSEIDLVTPRGPGPSEGIHEFLAFVVSGEEYAVDIIMIKEIIRPMTITYVPRAPRDVKGIISLRGTIVPILDLPYRLGLKDTVQGKMSRLLVISLGTGLIGFMVDSVTEVVKIRESSIEPPPLTLIGGSAKCIRGVGRFKDRMIILMEVEKTLDTQRPPQLPRTKVYFEPKVRRTFDSRYKLPPLPQEDAGEFLNTLDSSLTASKKRNIAIGIRHREKLYGDSR